MNTIDQGRVDEAVGKILGLVMGATLSAASGYLEHGLSEERIEPHARRAILDQLELTATALRVVDERREILELLTSVLDPAPTIAVMRAVQNSLILALSDDARVRAQRIGERELRERLLAEPVRRFLDPSEL